MRRGACSDPLSIRCWVVGVATVLTHCLSALAPLSTLPQGQPLLVRRGSYYPAIYPHFPRYLPPLQVQPLLGLLAAAFRKYEEAGG